MDKQLFKELCAIDGVSGREEAVRDYILGHLAAAPAPHEVTVDAMGNIIVHLIGRQKPAKKLLIDAHMDEVGFIVSHISDDGYLRFETIGGIDKQVLFGARVRIGDIGGVIGGKAFHHCSSEDAAHIPDTEDMLIDIGAKDGDAAKACVAVGDVGTFAAGFNGVGDGAFIGKAVDDRVGCALLLTIAQAQPPFDIWLSFSVQEEVGLRGAAVVGNTVKPDVAIALDATTAADTVGSARETAVCRVGDGAVVSFADRATVYDAELYQQIRSLAAQQHIPTQTKNRVAGGNNAGAIQRSHTGVRMAAISLPTRYIHSPGCFGSWRDVQAMEDLLKLLIERLPV